MSSNKSDENEKIQPKIVRGKFFKNKGFKHQSDFNVATALFLTGSRHAEFEEEIKSSPNEVRTLQTVEANEKATPIEKPLTIPTPASGIVKINLFILPFHHLVSVKDLTTNNLSENKLKEDSTYEERQQYYWQALASAGVSANEAILLDDVLHCKSLKLDADGNPVELFWEVKYFNMLEGCAEIYRTEMLLFKRLVYESGDNLRSIVTLSDEDFLPFLDNKPFEQLASKSGEELFFYNLFAPFDLTFSSRRTKKTNNKKVRKRKSITTYDENSIDFDSYITRGAKRIEGWRYISQASEIAKVLDIDSGKNNTDKNNADVSDDNSPSSLETAQPDDSYFRSTYFIDLTNYWADWQKLALKAEFDFDFLATLDNTRSIRFYELTKLWRAFMIGEKDELLPSKMEISYLELASLMPLPLYNSGYEIEPQIKEIIKPLKQGGYIKSFSMKRNWRNTNDQDNKLTFRFNEK